MVISYRLVDFFFLTHACFFFIFSFVSRFVLQAAVTPLLELCDTLKCGTSSNWSLLAASVEALALLITSCSGQVRCLEECLMHPLQCDSAANSCTFRMHVLRG